eukprot:TRINITY_DN5276_c0_g1_i1.p2 TRINITY_DN5276_c0_g1~~TRINITY_DN5276_c0_g1_i1.p2  ORF type:complete len:71 (+),score=2.54 TRINITY_DN5276_c0_g1_i1:385-597(+)
MSESHTTSLRGIKWRKLLGLEELKKFTSPVLYSQLVESQSDVREKIRRDINRTFPHHSFFSGRKKSGIAL